MSKAIIAAAIILSVTQLIVVFLESNTKYEMMRQDKEGYQLITTGRDILLFEPSTGTIWTGGAPPGHYFGWMKMPNKDTKPIKIIEKDSF